MGRNRGTPARTASAENAITTDTARSITCSPTGRAISTRAGAATSAIASRGLTAGRPDDNPARNIPAGFNRHTAGIAAKGITASTAITARAVAARTAVGRNRDATACTASTEYLAATASTACNFPGSPTGRTISARAGAATSAIASPGLTAGRPDDNPARNGPAGFNRHTTRVAARRITASAAIAARASTAGAAIGRNRGTPAVTASAEI